MKTFDQKVWENKEYTFPLGVALAEGDSIATTSAYSEPAGLTLSITTNAQVPEDVPVWITGGVAHTTYEVTLRVETTEGRKEEFYMTMNVT